MPRTANEATVGAVTPLPIDPHLPAALAAIRSGGTLVVVAAPGTGKSTRVAPAIAAALPGRTLLLQPRRIAARSLAKRIADERGWRLGDEVGFQVRFEKVGGEQTKLWVLTEGILTRRLVDDPYLDGVSAVLLDEFHERSLNTDLCLAWCAELRRTLRPDLVVGVMSATMDPEPVAKALGGAPILRVEAPTFPVQVAQVPQAIDRRLELQVCDAVTTALERDDAGDILVFLPGTGEIRACQAALAGIAAEVLPLHGQLPPEEQDRAIRPGDRQRVILATNVAETSLTIPGIRTVIDSGLARVARFNPDSGLDELKIEHISRASADQRAGRAGRTAPGRCVRLWSPLVQARMDADTDPEIRRVDLAPTLLALRRWHGDDARTFPWYEAPEAVRLDAGEQLLALIGAIDGERGPLTALGNRLARLPLHPRLGRLLMDAGAAGQPQLGARLAAVIQGRDVRLAPHRDRAPTPSSADALDRLEALARAQAQRFDPRLRDEGIDVGAAREATWVCEELLRSSVSQPAGDSDLPLAVLVPRLLLAAYPDRLAKRAAPDQNRCAMVGGIGIEIDRLSAVAARPGFAREPLIVAVELVETGGATRSVRRARQAAEITDADLEAVFPSKVVRRSRLSWNVQRGAVDAEVGWYFADLCLRMEKGAQAEPDEVSRFLAARLLEELPVLLAADEAAASLVERLRWLTVACPDTALPSFTDADLATLVNDLSAGCRTRAEVVAKGLHDWIRAKIGFDQAKRIDALAPTHLEVPTGSRIRLDYSNAVASAAGASNAIASAAGAAPPPILAVRLQELFGCPATPTIADGRIPVLLHLLGPNYRCEQVTRDLASFWANTYPKVRKDLRGRYPKHSWPEDPLAAPAVRRGPSQRS